MSTTKAEGKVVQYLYEAHATELAQIQTLSTHIAMTPSGPYRQILERHQRETRGHADRVRNRLRAIEQHGVLDLVMDAGRIGMGLVQGMASTVLATARAPLDLLRGGVSGEEKLLKNAKDECAGEALEIATYEAIEELAERVGDQETRRMAAAIRGDEERFLTQLRDQIPALTEAVLEAELGRGTYQASRTGAAQAARAAGRSASRSARRSGEALAEAGREAAEATQAAGREAAEAGEGAARQVSRGAQRSARELTRGASRATARARGSGGASRRRAPSRPPAAPTAKGREPWPGYDEQRVEEITDRLEQDDAGKAEQVREYERQHKDRTGVIEAAEKEAGKEEDQSKEQRPEG